MTLTNADRAAAGVGATPEQALSRPTRHILVVSGGRLQPESDSVHCRDCQVSCQSACKTSCTVGNQRCPK